MWCLSQICKMLVCSLKKKKHDWISRWSFWWVVAYLPLSLYSVAYRERKWSGRLPILKKLLLWALILCPKLVSYIFVDILECNLRSFLHNMSQGGQGACQEKELWEHVLKYWLVSYMCQQSPIFLIQYRTGVKLKARVGGIWSTTSFLCPAKANQAHQCPWCLLNLYQNVQNCHM